MLKGGDLHPQSRSLTFPVTTMKRNTWFCAFSLFAIALGAFTQNGWAKEKEIKATPKSYATANTQGSSVEFFDAVDAGQINAKFIALNDHEAKLIVTNNTNQPVNLKLPEAFAGVPVAAQFGGGGGARGGGGGARTGGGGGGGGQQSVGGGGGGGGLGGGGGGGGGGGFFSVPPEKTAKIDIAVVCLDHGLRDPSSSAPYKMVPADSHVDRPAVVELLKAFGRGELNHAATQAAAWHLNSNLSWQQLAAKQQGTKRSFRRPPYFSADEIRIGMTYATEAQRLAEANADEYKRAKKERAEKAIKSDSSDVRSTTDTETNEPAKTDAVKNQDAQVALDRRQELKRPRRAQLGAKLMARCLRLSVSRRPHFFHFQIANRGQ